MLRDTKEIVLCKDSSWYRRLIYFFLFKMSFMLYCSCSRCCNSSRSWQAIKQQWANEYVPREGYIYVYERVHTQDMGFMNERRTQGMVSIWVDMNTPNREPTALMTIAPPHFIWKWNWLTGKRSFQMKCHKISCLNYLQIDLHEATTNGSFRCGVATRGRRQARELKHCGFSWRTDR